MSSPQPPPAPPPSAPAPPASAPADAPIDPASLSDDELVESVHDLDPKQARRELEQLRTGSAYWSPPDPSHAFARRLGAQLEHVILVADVGAVRVEALADLLRRGAAGRAEALDLIRELEADGPRGGPNGKAPLWDNGHPRHREAVALRSALYKIAYSDESKP